MPGYKLTFLSIAYQEEARTAGLEQGTTTDQLYTIRPVDRPGANCNEEEYDMDEDEQECFELTFTKQGPLGVILIESYHPRQVFTVDSPRLSRASQVLVSRGLQLILHLVSFL